MTQPEPFGATEPEDTRSSPERKRRRRRITHAIVWPVVALVLIGGGFAAWTLYDSAMSVRGDLEEARNAVGAFQQAATDRQLDQLQPIADQLSASAERAVEPTTQPLWRAAEYVPFVGENFRAVRVIAEGVDEVSSDIVDPAVGLVGSFGLQRDPASGGFDLAPLREATEIVADGRSCRRRPARRGAIHRHGCHHRPGVRGGRPVRRDADKAEEAIPQVEAALAGVGSLLGVDGPKNVVLAFLNNAEASPSAAAGRADAAARRERHGVDRAAGLERRLPDAIPVGAVVDRRARWSCTLTRAGQSNSATSRPDFPTAAAAHLRPLAAHVRRHARRVVSIDPLGLSRLLQVTGPVTMPNGEELDSGNVVSKLLNEAYFRFPEGGAESDAYFAAAASAVFERIMSLDYDVFAMVQALIDMANHGSLMMWSADQATQALFDGTRLQGTLPTGNEGATVLGVYFRERSIVEDRLLPAHRGDRDDEHVHARRADVHGGGAARGSTSRPTSSSPAVHRSEYSASTAPRCSSMARWALRRPRSKCSSRTATTTGPSVVDLGVRRRSSPSTWRTTRRQLVRATFAGAPGTTVRPRCVPRR